LIAITGIAAVLLARAIWPPA